MITTLLRSIQATYTVAAEARGFQKSVIASFTLTVNQHARVDLTFESLAL